MAIVVRGLGLPEDGALVAGGLGVSESDPNAMAATITVVGLLSGSLTDGNTGLTVAAGSPGGRPLFVLYPPKPPRVRPGLMAADLVVTSSLVADLDFLFDFDSELEVLLMAGVL